MHHLMLPKHISYLCGPIRSKHEAVTTALDTHRVNVPFLARRLSSYAGTRCSTFLRSIICIGLLVGRFVNVHVSQRKNWNELGSLNCRLCAVVVAIAVAVGSVH